MKASYTVFTLKEMRVCSVVACTRTLGALFDTLVYCSIGFNGKGRQAGERTNFALLHTHSLFGLLWRDRCRFGELREEVNGNWEDNRRVLLCCDGTQSLIRKRLLSVLGLIATK